MPPSILRSRIAEGSPNPLGATWDGLGVNFALFSAHATRSNCACSTTTASPRSSASSCPNTPTRSGTATCRTPGPAPSTAIGCTAPTSPTQGTASIPTSCCSTPTPRRLSGSFDGIDACSAIRSGPRTTICPSTTATARPSCRNAASSTPPSPGAATARRGPLGPHHHLRNACQGLYQAPSGRAGAAARHVAGLGHKEVVDYIRSLGVTSVELLPDTRVRRRPLSGRQGADELLGLQHHRVLRAGPALLGAPTSPSRSSRKWSRGCTTPDSR